jgi:hypothetical protein
MQRQIKNEEQMIAFCEEQITWLKEFKKSRQQFIKENLSEDELIEYRVVVEDNNE